MKKLFNIVLFILASNMVFGQAAWVEPETPDVTKTVRLYVDLDKTTNQSLAAETGPFYIWTWKPIEHPAGHPLVNGIGDKAWKNSNDALQMTKDDSKGARVYYYEMVPTVFYEVSATEVYSKGISFLVKPKDGGGFGDPDLKTEDLVLTIEPPKLTRGLIYQFPTNLLKNEIVTIFYNNPKDSNTSMHNLSDGDALLWVKFTGTDTTTGNLVTIEPTKFFFVQDDPRLTMRRETNGMFSLTFIPSKLFNIPGNITLKDIECTVRKKNYTTSNDRVSEQPKFKFGCN